MSLAAMRMDLERAPKRERKPKQERKGPTARDRAAVKAERWARWFTGTSVVLSSGLNGYAAVRESGQSGLGAYAAALIGAVIPVLVWMLATVTSWTYRAGWKRLALASGSVAACLLALSVVHVAGSLSALTGASPLLAGLFAIGIDFGLAASETTAILVSVE